MSNTATESNNARSRQGRIPLTLQAVFLASNRGKEVHKPPPSSAGNKTFFRNWFLQRRPVSSKRNGFDSVKSIASENSEGKTMKKLFFGSSDDSAALSPQVYLDMMLRSRGYSTKRYKTLQSAYYNKATSFQEASYDQHLIGVVRRDDVKEFKAMIDCGLSQNPSNNFGTSMAHMVSRRGNHEMLKVLIDRGCSLQIADDYGRTPLHDACWAANPSFETVKLILDQDHYLTHMIDARGHIPLNYVREDDWAEFNAFLDSVKDKYWPVDRDVVYKTAHPALTKDKPNSHRLPDPSNALPIDMAKMVAAGRLKPSEARLLADEDEEDTQAMTDDESHFLSECGDETDFSDSESYYSDSDYDEDEMEDLLINLPIGGSPFLAGGV